VFQGGNKRRLPLNDQNKWERNDFLAVTRRLKDLKDEELIKQSISLSSDTFG
jgi:hypothetical protein